MNGDDCLYTDIAEWEKDGDSERIKPLIWCKKYNKFCSDVADCKYKAEDGNDEQRENTLDWLYRLRSEIYVYMPKEWLIPMNNALDIAIKALEHPEKNVVAVVPCGDCISREQALVAIRNLYPDMPRVDFNGSLRKWVDKYKPYIECDDAIKQLPSVTPQEPKTGHWINCKCDKCGYVVQPWNTTNYCPNCGFRMVEPQESEKT